MKKKKTIIEPEEDKPTKVDIPKHIPKQVLDLPIIGNCYFFTTNNLVGYGILKTVEGIFDENGKVKSYRYEIILNGVSYVVTELFSNMGEVASKIWI